MTVLNVNVDAHGRVSVEPATLCYVRDLQPGHHVFMGGDSRVTRRRREHPVRITRIDLIGVGKIRLYYSDHPYDSRLQTVAEFPGNHTLTTVRTRP